MINTKVLNDSAWKDLSSKNKIKDNGLLKTLSEIKQLREDDHDGASKLYEEALKLGTQLKKSRWAALYAAADRRPHQASICDPV